MLRSYMSDSVLPQGYPSEISSPHKIPIGNYILNSNLASCYIIHNKIFKNNKFRNKKERRIWSIFCKQE